MTYRVVRQRVATISKSAIAVVAIACLSVFSEVIVPVAAEGISKHLVCNFTSGTTTTFESGSFKSAEPKPFGFEISKINLAKQSASLVGNDRQIPGQLKIVRAINANHFIEVVNEGYMNLTTVYDADPKSGKFPAVHSRHLGILGQPIFAQYTGLCSPKT